MNSDERFAVAQALYKAVAGQVSTRTEDNLRAEIDRASVELYAATGGTVRELVVNGAKVGEVRAETKSGWRVTDPEAFEAWCRENDAMDGEVSIDWTLLGPDDYWTAWNWLRDHYPQMFVSTEWPMKPDDNWLDHVGGTAIDRETGEIVPGVEYGTEVVKTVVTGCKWDEASMNKTELKKFAPVSVAARGLPGGAVAALSDGGRP